MRTRPTIAPRLKPLAISLFLHGAFACVAVYLYLRTDKLSPPSTDTVFVLQNDAPQPETNSDATTNPAGELTPQPLPAETPPPTPPPAAAAENNSIKPGENAPLLSDLPSMRIAPGGELIKDDQLTVASASATLTNTNHPDGSSSEPEMDTYFAIFTQTLKDAYTIPSTLPAKRDYSVRIQYEVAADGTIGLVTVLRSSGSAVYDASVVAAFKAMRTIGPRPDNRSTVLVADFRI